LVTYAYIFNSAEIFCKRLTTRTKSITAILTQSIPFIGVAVLIADTGYELYAACETVRDLDQLYADLGMAEEVPDDAMHSVCDPELLDAGEVWGGAVENVASGWIRPGRLCSKCLSNVDAFVSVVWRI
jgi:hypothetical protein